jgi:hypothetical protein
MQQQTPYVSAPEPPRWWRIETAPGQSVDQIQAEFRSVFESAGAPAGAALFCNHVVRVSTTLFVTPKGASIAQAFLESHAGTPCEPPAEGIFLVGHESDRNLLPVPELMKHAEQ